MAKRARVVAMPASKRSSGWFKPEITSTLLLTVGVWIVGGGVVYGVWTTKLQEQELRRIEFEKRYETDNAAKDRKFETILTAVEAVKTKAQEIGKIDDQARSRVRDEFLKAQESTNLALAKLDTRAAVAETRYEQMVTTLNKISDQMASVVRGSQSQTDRRGR